MFLGGGAAAEKLTASKNNTASRRAVAAAMAIQRDSSACTLGWQVWRVRTASSQEQC
jgi:hypothetical protein